MTVTAPRSLAQQHRQAGLLRLKEGDVVAAEDAFRQAVELSPDLPNHRQHADTLFRLGREEEARAVFARAFALSDSSLPRQLAPALSLQDRSDWDVERRFAWGRRAQELTRQWVFGPRHADQLEALVDAPAWSALTERLEPGRGAVLVDTHVGMPHLAYARLPNAGLPVRLVVANSEVLLTFPPEMTVNARAADNAAALLRLRASIRQGALVHLVGDGGIGRKDPRRVHRGYGVSLPLGPPTLAYAARSPIFWHAALWCGGRIEVQLEECPPPEPGEPLDHFRARWLDFYWTRLTAALDSAPENLDRRQFDALHGPAKPR